MSSHGTVVPATALRLRFLTPSTLVQRCLERLRQHRQDIEQSRRLQQVKAPTRARGGWVSHPTGAVQPRFGDAAAAHTSIVDSILGDEW